MYAALKENQFKERKTLRNMLSKLKCKIPWVPYIAFIKKLTTAKGKGLKSSTKKHILT